MKKFFRKFLSDKGNVIVEFTLTAVALFVPIAYVSAAITQIAVNYIAVQDAARAGARLFATSEIESSGRIASQALVKSLLTNSPKVQTSIICSNNPCLVRDGIITFQVDQEVTLALPLMPYPISINLSGAQAEVVQDSE